MANNQTINDRRGPFNMVSLFAGIGGFELAFQEVNIKTILMCEIDPTAQCVLRERFPNTPLVGDVCTLEALPENTDIVCAGFPCQDLSSVGEKMGLAGSRSSLVREVFRLLNNRRAEWALFENVPFMLRLNNGEAIRTIIQNLEELGYKWAYRTIDSISFVPQHRSRVFILASLHHDPCDVLLSGEATLPYLKVNPKEFSSPLGFYWTEGRSALGLTNNAVPTLKAGSTIGIPSSPAIAFPNGEVSVPDIRDAERLQGFPAGWTQPATKVSKQSSRWKLVGNAITVNSVSWIAHKIIAPQKYDGTKDKLLTGKWPKAAWGQGGIRYTSRASLYPVDVNHPPLEEFLSFPRKRLSLKASLGFESRLLAGGLHAPQYFKDAIHNHIISLEG